MRTTGSCSRRLQESETENDAAEVANARSKSGRQKAAFVATGAGGRGCSYVESRGSRIDLGLMQACALLLISGSWPRA